MQIIFRIKLTWKQWAAVIVLCAGCSARQCGFGRSDAVTTAIHLTTIEYLWSLAIILFFAASSAMAVVCHERLLKFQGGTEDIHLQNIFLSLHQMIIQLVLFAYVLLAMGNTFQEGWEDVLNVWRLPWLVVLVVNNAVIALVGTFVLRYLNSISRTFAASIEILVVPWASYCLFGMPVYMHTVAAVALVSASLYLYGLNPVVNKGPSLKRNSKQWKVMDERGDVEKI